MLKSKNTKGRSPDPRSNESLPPLHSSSLSNHSNDHHSSFNRNSAKSELSRDMSSKKPKPKIQLKETQQIMIEFIPDSFYINSSSEVNFIANPVIPNISIPSGFPSLNLP